MRMRSILLCKASLYGWLQKAGKDSTPLLPSPTLQLQQAVCNRCLRGNSENGQHYDAEAALRFTQELGVAAQGNANISGR